ncbi:MAG: hypothetical protein PVH52_05770 [bacterium]|jgi:hypothetical protein
MGTLKLIAAILITAVAVGSVAYLWHISATKDLREQIETEPPEYCFLKLYWADPETLTARPDFLIPVPESLSLTEKLEVLARQLSRHKFGRLPIVVRELREQDGKRIASIDLRETDWNRHIFKMWDSLAAVGERQRADSVFRKRRRPTWRVVYFQGTCGGTQTTRTLIHTFLQEDYEGEWIDAAEFYYEGDPMSEDRFEHTNLGGTKIRRTTRNGGPSP